MVVFAALRGIGLLSKIAGRVPNHKNSPANKENLRRTFLSLNKIALLEVLVHANTVSCPTLLSGPRLIAPTHGPNKSALLANQYDSLRTIVDTDT
jgi:hypothetical protein